MSKKNQLPSISLAIDDSSRTQAVRHSLQPKPHAATDDNAYRSRSQSYNQKTQVKIQSPIPEVDTEDDETQVHIGNGNSATSFTKKTPSRTNSIVGSTARKISEVKGYDNRGFDDQFQRGFADSTRSSAISLQVQREQYCCCARWTPFERRLAISVGVLAGVIIGLAIAVGLLARDDKGVDEHFIWKP